MEISRNGATLTLTGQFDVRNTMDVRAALYEHLADCVEGTNVVVDLTRVTTVDLTALKVLAYATHTAQRQGQRLSLRGCGPHVLRMLHLSHLIRFVEVERAGEAIPA